MKGHVNYTSSGHRLYVMGLWKVNEDWELTATVPVVWREWVLCAFSAPKPCKASLCSPSIMILSFEYP